MIKNYFKIAWRNLVKNKINSFINIAGLSVGMAVAILIGLWIYDELSFDQYHQNYNRIALVEQNLKNNGEIDTWAATPYPLANELRKNYGSSFKAVVMAAGMGKHMLSLGDKKLNKMGVYFEPQAPEMFSLKMLKGTRDGLKDPYSVLISASNAKAYFGDADPINKVLKIDNKLDVKVTGVYEDLPRNSTFGEITFIAPWQLYFNNTEWVRTAADPWRPNAFQIFVQLIDNTSFADVSAKIKDAKLRNLNPELAKKKPALFLQPMSKWHLYSDFKNGVNVGGRIQYVWLFGVIGLFVLLLACINFMNLSTARSEKRAKEVGIRKAIGSLRSQLIYQFFTESLLFVILSLALSILLVQVSLPFFNSVSDKSMSVLWGNPLFWVMVIGFSLFTGLIAGSYPALYLSSFEPIKVLKGSFKVGRFAAVPRKVLVVIQFTVSITLIIGTIIVFRQIQFAKDRPIGYSRDGLVALPVINDDVHKHFDVVKTELLKSEAVISIAEAGASPTEYNSSSSGFDWRGKDPNMSVDFPTEGVSYDYEKTIGWKFKQGRGFSRSFLTDSSGLVINQTAAHFMGMNDNAVGETIKWNGEKLKVIGVIKDMIVKSPYEEVRPFIFYLSKEAESIVLLKINPKMSATEALGKIENIFKIYNPSQPFEYHFVDDDYALKFGNEQRIGKLAACFAGLAIFISCLGLFGMATFLAEQRIKEIGVRKVLGASVFSLWRLMSADFVVLVIIAILIATPVSYYFMNSWLQGYQYHAAMVWWIFFATATGAMVITLLTVSYQSIRAALLNPVKSLKTE
ncbi:ABC transporter permease [Mucilaginibacter sp. FT3.2]|uniref:ABC transporter permease n=1 Tax=Mucilaginibacter sp. FT3.2 TaxID=2723090 RepID=UPI0016108151|nr:ABC transporter permease [Mucilaginibacter sp. FT3.2]MBB6232311.1 ABC-type antimicrobial peptide transport system permease subunit [Mucilaginibacter sp. FT3.2]